MHVKKMLEKVNSGAAVTPIEARDAMLGCFVTIHGESLKRGAELLGKSLSDTEAEKHATVIMKGLLGNNWDKPTSKSLHEARIVMDRKMSFSKAPKDLRDMHDQTCNLIVGKL
jgi:hypothetical protein